MNARTWAIIIVALPVLYLASVPPISSGVTRYLFKVEQDTGVRVPDPEWLFDYAYPYAWLVMYTPLKRPLKAYSDWWIEAYGMQVPR